MQPAGAGLGLVEPVAGGGGRGGWVAGELAAVDHDATRVDLAGEEPVELCEGLRQPRGEQAEGGDDVVGIAWPDQPASSRKGGVVQRSDCLGGVVGQLGDRPRAGHGVGSDPGSGRFSSLFS